MLVLLQKNSTHLALIKLNESIGNHDCSDFSEVIVPVVLVGFEVNWNLEGIGEEGGEDLFRLIATTIYAATGRL